MSDRSPCSSYANWSREHLIAELDARDAERANRGVEVARLKTEIVEERAHWEAVRDEALAVSKRNYLEAERLRDEIQQLTRGARP